MMWWSRCVGVAPVRFEKLSGAGWRVRTSLVACILSFLLVILLDVSIFVSPFINFKGADRIIGKSQVRCIIILTNNLAMVIWATNAVFGAPKRTLQIIRCVKRVEKVTESLNEYIKLHSYRNIKIYHIIGFSCFLSFGGFALNYWHEGILVVTGRFTLFDELYNNPIFGIMHLMVMMAKFQFTISAMKVFSTIRSINDVLEQIDKSSTSHNGFLSVPGYRKLKPIDEVIRHLSSLYVETCDVVEELNSSCGCSILLLLTSCFLQLITQSYWLSQYIFISMKSITKTICLLIWCLIQIMWLVEIVEPCHRTKLEIDRTNLLISNLSNNLTVRSISVELEKLSQYLALNQVGYSPMGVCTLSRSIIATIIANVTTYLVIIIQFQSSDVDKVGN